MAEPDSNARSSEARRRRRRQVRIRRAVAIGVLLALVAGIVVGARAIGGGHPGAQAEPLGSEKTSRLPEEIRGVHVTMSLASLPDKLQEYLDLPGLNTIELDVKDEVGRVGFVPSVPLARGIDAAGPFYRPRQVARQVHARGDYLIGRVVTFEDPVLAEKRPGLAVQNADGTVWHNDAGLGWTNPYDRRVWR